MPAMTSPEIQKRVLHLANEVGLSHREISWVVGIARGTVRSIVNRGYVKYVSDIVRNPENYEPLDGKVVEALARQLRKALGNSTKWEENYSTTLDLVHDERPRYEEAKRMMLDRIDVLQTAEASDD